MIDISLSDFINEHQELKIPTNALILLDKSFRVIENRIFFSPQSVIIHSDSGDYQIENVSIPIRKVEKDQDLQSVFESLVIEKPNYNYINANDITKSISWWVVNNADELGYPDDVMITFTGYSGIPHAMIFERTGNKKWEPSDFIRIQEEAEAQEKKRPSPLLREAKSKFDSFIDETEMFGGGIFK